MSRETPHTIRDSAVNIVESWKNIWKWVYLVLKWTTKWIRNVFVLWYDTLKMWDKAIAKQINKKDYGSVVKFFSDKMLRGMWAIALAWWLVIWWQKIDFKKFEHTSNERDSMTEFLGDDTKVFWVDVSCFNDEWDVNKFTNWWNERENSKNPDKRRPRFVYILWRKEKWQDELAITHLSNLREHQSQLSWNKWLAVGCYAYFDKSKEWITDQGIEKQVNEFIKVWKIINEEWDWLIDLAPMLDFEFSYKEKEKLASSEEGKQFKKAILKWLKLFEEKTWVRPWIYANASTYRDYFYWDLAFSKYFSWIACYNEKMVDQDRWTVTYQWTQMDADIIQFSDKIQNSWFWTTNGRKIDWNTSTQWKFWKLIQDNEDAPKK